MKIAGIIAAKENSNRFPGKNYKIYKEKPLFFHNAELLRRFNIIDDIFIATDSEFIKNYSEHRGFKVIDRKPNISEDEQPIFEVLKYCYYCLPEKYDIIITILANTINHTLKSIEQALNLLINSDLWEVRSYNEQGIENGIIAMKTEIFQKHEISWYSGMVISPGKEIHYKKDLEDYC